MTKRHKLGFTLLEATASIVIISIVLVMGMTLLIQSRNQSIANQNLVSANQYSQSLMIQMTNQLSYDDVLLWLDGDSKTLTLENCSLLSESCFFFQLSGYQTFESISIVFDYPDEQMIDLGVLAYTIEIEYVRNRTMRQRGLIYDAS